MAVVELLSAIVALFRFYFRYISAFGRIHSDVGDGRMMPLSRKHAGTNFEFDASFATEFNENLRALEDVMRRCRRYSLDYPTILIGCHILRWITCVVAFVAPKSALFIGALQFLVAPFSLPIAVMKLFSYGVEGVVHYVLAVCMGLLIGEYGPSFTIGLWSLACFLMVDQLVNMCVYVLWSEPFPPLTLLKHIIYGTANTKLYYFIVFGCLQGLQVNIVLVALTSALTILVNSCFMAEILRVTGLPNKHVRFYMDHRLGHLPVVYTHAHKMHHQFHDTTAWDAHTYGNGMNEHYFLMLLDVLPCMIAPSFFFVPYCFNGLLTYVTWANKPHHTRLKEGTPYDYYMNFHADHHSYHNKNFALMDGALLDFYFGTQTDKCPGTNGVLLFREEKLKEDSSLDKIVVKVSIDSKKD